MSPVIYGCMRIDDVESSLTCKINQGCLSEGERGRGGGGRGEAVTWVGVRVRNGSWYVGTPTAYWVPGILE